VIRRAAVLVSCPPGRCAWDLVEVILASIAGAYFYREAAAGRPVGV
jgi:hypothetical protein